MSLIEDTLMFQIKVAGLPIPEREHRFDAVRKWRMDFAWVDKKVAVEVEGVLFTRMGRHQTAIGLEMDCQKYNSSILQGWRVLRFTQRMVTSGEALKTIEAVLNAQ